MASATPNVGRSSRGRPPVGVRDAILAATLEILARDGLAGLTTRQVARRAKASEASVFYHFGDKVGLLQEAMLAGLGALKDLAASSHRSDRSVSATLGEITRALDSFFDRSMPIFSAVQADAKLRSEFAARLTKGDRGPHRGVQLIGAYLESLKASGRVDPDLDSDAVALMLVGAAFVRAWQRQLTGTRARPALPSGQATAAALAALLEGFEAGRSDR